MSKADDNNVDDQTQFDWYCGLGVLARDVYFLTLDLIIAYGVQILFQVVPNGPIWSHLVLLGLIWSQLVLFDGPTWSYVVLLGPMWSYLVLFDGPTWSYLVLCGPMWSYLVLLGPMSSSHTGAKNIHVL